GDATQVIALEPNSLDDVLEDIQRVADALGQPRRGTGLVRAIRDAMDDIIETAHTLQHAPSVAVIEWIDPLMAAGNWMPELVAMAGGRNLFGTAGKHSPWLEWEALCSADPDVLVVIPCGYDIQTTLKEMPSMTTRPGWADLSAVKNDRVYVADGNAYFNRPGPRLVESLEILAQILHPTVFCFQYEGSGWVRWPA
ncbi:MAG: ABC transporter substrate-binding protein, partial [Chloroflexota bacterium]